MRQLIFIHGRAQEHKDSTALKQEWLEALHEGLAKSGLTLPLRDADIRFPFYGDTLFDLVAGRSSSDAAAVVVRGTEADRDEMRFVRAVLEEVRTQVGITDAQLADVAGSDVVQRGPQNWEWLQGVLRAVDRFVPHGSGAAIALATRDVYQYLNNTAIRLQIDDGVAQALTAGRDAVVVSHSLGTVVAYHLLSTQGVARGWETPLFITLGSPLGISEVRKAVRGSAGPLRCPPCASAWFNAMDERDVVALFPLTTGVFPLDPAQPSIENKTDVSNRTQNRHGIAGYLDDAEVARRIYDAVTH
jgi:hypothetical protein